ncbi:hypothetical protein HK096_008723, partial [Nowakowskiella sp. JEL0078]
MKIGDFQRAKTIYSQVKQWDNQIIDHMEYYASLLQNDGNSLSLNKCVFFKFVNFFKKNRLANEMMQTSENRQESWLVLAHYSELKGDMEKALGFTEKVQS